MKPSCSIGLIGCAASGAKVSVVKSQYAPSYLWTSGAHTAMFFTSGGSVIAIRFSLQRSRSVDVRTPTPFPPFHGFDS